MIDPFGNRMISFLLFYRHIGLVFTISETWKEKEAVNEVWKLSLLSGKKLIVWNQSYIYMSSDASRRKKMVEKLWYFIILCFPASATICIKRKTQLHNLSYRGAEG